MVQHGSLTPERWMGFTLDQQILMIANEMNRAASLMHPADWSRLLNAYERILRLTDLSICVNSRNGLRRELLRWRDLIAELFVDSSSNPMAHAAAFRCLLRFTPTASLQIPYLTQALYPEAAAVLDDASSDTARPSGD